MPTDVDERDTATLTVEFTGLRPADALTARYTVSGTNAAPEPRAGRTSPNGGGASDE